MPDRHEPKSVARAMPRVAISAPHRSSGKSTLTTGLCAALRDRGLEVQPFKKGPDFIDPMWLTAAAGRRCRSLDFFMMGSAGVEEAFARHGADARCCLVECNHGLHDGLDPEGGDSSAALVKLLAAPVILVVDASRAARGIAPLVLGQVEFDRGVRTAGVILNRVNSPRHERKIRDSLRRYCNLPVLGVIPFRSEMEIAERHLGLTPLLEDPALHSRVRALGRAVAEHIDLDAVLEIARSAPDYAVAARAAPDPSGARTVRIGIAMDRAFNFYYPENLEALEAAGAELVPFSPLADRSLPAVEGLYIGGGFPEFFMDDLEGNEGMRGSLREAIEKGLPAWAECGGLMYLTRRLHWRGRSRRMAGVFSCDVEMSDRPEGHGYVVLEETGRSPWPQKGRKLRGHEFHHSRVTNLPGDAVFAYRMLRGSGLTGGFDGLAYRNCLATYTHLHSGGAPFWGEDFVAFCRQTTDQG